MLLIAAGVTEQAENGQEISQLRRPAYGQGIQEENLEVEWRDEQGNRNVHGRAQTAADVRRVTRGAAVGQHGYADALDALLPPQNARNDLIHGKGRPGYADKAFA